MELYLIPRCRRVMTIVATTILYAVPTPTLAMGAQNDGVIFDGGGRGPTEEIAIRRAVEDAEVSASASQLFTCELVGEPQIFPGPNPEWGRNFRAQVTVECIP